jgi:tRNA A-37 threonylcarbamoyl transferase component Bud32
MKPAEVGPEQSPGETADQRDAAAATGVRSSRQGELVGAIWEEMRAGWAGGQQLRAEQFLTREFLLACGDEGAVDIIYGEFALAEAHGGRPHASEYLHRFPQFASGLARQLSLHAAIELVPSGTAPLPAYSPPPATKSVTDSLPCPGQFGRYLLVAPLDSGGQSRVYRAVHPDLGKEVVLKVARQTSGPEAAQHSSSLAAEAKILADLSHPHLARIYDAGVIDGRAFLAMEYVRGRTLSQHARFTQLTPEQIVSIVAKTARALAVVHAHGILHLDIKPKNIVIDERGEPRLIDFGLSRHEHAWSDVPNEEGLAGTLEFMAPEQARCETVRLGPTTDIFSLGGVLYFLLTGSPVFAAKNARESLQLAQRCQWDRQALDKFTIPARLRQCCEQALAAEPAARFDSADNFVTALERSIAPPTANGWQRRLAIVAIACLILAAFVGFNMIAQRLLAPRPALVLPLQFAANVWQDGQRRELSHAVPLLNGDEVQFTAQISPRQAARLVLINSQGELQLLREVRPQPGTWNLAYPAEEFAAPLQGAAGTEGAFIVVGQDAVPIDELQQLWADSGTEWPALPEHAILRVTETNVVVDQSGRDLGAAVRKADPELTVKNRLEEFRRLLTEKGLRCEGLFFSHGR